MECKAVFREIIEVEAIALIRTVQHCKTSFLLGGSKHAVEQNGHFRVSDVIWIFCRLGLMSETRYKVNC